MSRELTQSLMSNYHKLAAHLMELEEVQLAQVESDAIRTEDQRDILASLADVIMACAQELTNSRLEDFRDQRAEVLKRTIVVSTHWI